MRKRSMFRPMLVGVALLVAPGIGRAGDQLVVVTGSGSAETQPDRVTIEFSVVHRGKTAAEASSGCAKDADPVFAALRALGVPDSAVTSAGFGVQSPWDSKRGTRQENVSIATQRVRVRIRETRTAGAVVEAVLDHGADRIESVGFSVSDLDSARQAALTQAVRQARLDAETMARAAGGTLGSLIELTTQGTAAPPRTYDSIGMRMALVSGSPAMPSITPGPTVVTVTVLGRWTFAELK